MTGNKAPNGLYAARKLIQKRKKFRWSERKYKQRMLRTKEKFSPIGTAPIARAIVLEKYQIGKRQPNHGRIPVVRVQIVKTGKIVSAWVPFDGSLKHIEPHDEVIICGIGGPMGRSLGDIPGIRYKVELLNGAHIKLIAKGKIQKPSR